jgi:acetoin utilization deacetylase AcuC-like enzyme
VKRNLLNNKRLTQLPLNNDIINADSTDKDMNGSFGQELVQRKGTTSASYPLCNDNWMVSQTHSLHPSTKVKKKKAVQIVLLHSHSHTQILHEAMEYIHQDRDILLESLLKWCGIINGAQRGGSLSSFLTILPPRMGTRDLLDKFHSSEYLNLLEYPAPKVDGTLSFQSSNVMPSEVIDAPSEEESYMQHRPSEEILSQHGLEDDCPYPTSPTSHALLWKYCLAIAGASCHAASLLTPASDSNDADVAIHWGGGRHHAHISKASGFCYVSDVILAIQRLLNNGHDRIIYIDIDIHHADAVQNAFYDTNRVLTVSFHRYTPGFFPATSGSNSEKGEKVGFGYNLNLPLPAGVDNVQFVQIYREALFGLVNAYDPHAVVLCVGADGLEGDALISGGLGGDSVTPGEGWALSPEGLAECVRLTAAHCAGLNDESVPPIDAIQEEMVGPNNNVQIVKPDTLSSGKRRKLLLLGGGGYVSSLRHSFPRLCASIANI